MKRRLAGALCVGAALLMGSCGGSEGDVDGGITPDDAASALRVGHFDFPESALLAEMYVTALKEAGIPVRLVTAAAPREVVGPALEQGLIDVVPEYLGTATVFFGVGTASPAIATTDELRARLEPRGLTALDAAAAQNSNVFVVRADSGLGPLLSDLEDTDGLRLGAVPECADRPLCLPGLEARYRLSFSAFVPQPSVAMGAEALRRGEIDVALMFSTDAIITEEFLVLEDDKLLQPPENVIPVIRQDALARWGNITVTTALDRVSSSLDTETLRQLNRLMARGEDPGDVAREWLSRSG